MRTVPVLPRPDAGGKEPCRSESCSNRTEQFLDEKQVQMTLAREFYLAVRLKNEKPDTAYTLLSTIETKFRDNGFTTRRAGKEDLKRLLAIYFEQNTTTERFEDYDGQRFLEVI